MEKKKEKNYVLLCFENQQKGEGEWVLGEEERTQRSDDGKKKGKKLCVALFWEKEREEVAFWEKEKVNGCIRGAFWSGG